MFCKIFSKYGGIIGAFNCQGADWDHKEQKLRDYPESYKAISGSVHVDKIEWKQKQMGSAMHSITPPNLHPLDSQACYCGGTIQGLRYKASGSRPSAEIKVKGGWNFLAYSSECPKKCYLNGVWMVFE
ncbi:hypothetical protein FH972_005765 [Carpinus fangiana]|uniref:Uncharacterized protein n=1 Tax=Carpinus fangiana TaxID=176857 RepID=A0A5N6QQ88_9ROSI|nr:hypothetical protein FH972_005765 [Carpinus fangiana]